ncbi:tetratricopeptide repeat protein [Saccharolobus shibatae]|uniref:Tetratricopeptide repeat protein n=1 Tax=Saccharolobus shibatae TaxID=2286 RepID=A0A8F5GWS2_9CREN|nr:hypothetical protein [Saccharolobus shibatae]QXJ32369.1 hypothetical protein J5U21_02020 [Saccharolobus shibatae]
MASNESCDKLIKDGIELYNSNSFIKALDEFKRVLELCPNDEKALLWKGKTDLVIGKLDEAIRTLRLSLTRSKDSTITAEAQFYLALSMFLYSFFSVERDKVLQIALSYICDAKKKFKELKDEYFEDLAQWLENLILIESDKISSVASSESLMAPLSEIQKVYLDLKMEGFEGLIDRIYAVLYYFRDSKKNSSDIFFSSAYYPKLYLKQPFIDFMRDFLYVILARTFVEGYGYYDEALFALSKVSGGNVMRLLALLYKAQIYEEIGKKGLACMSYSEILRTFNAPNVREKMILLGCNLFLTRSRQKETLNKKY